MTAAWEEEKKKKNHIVQTVDSDESSCVKGVPEANGGSHSSSVYLHPSHRHHREHDHELLLQVHLMPSGHQCRIQINTHEKKKRRYPLSDFIPPSSNREEDTDGTPSSNAQNKRPRGLVVDHQDLATSEENYESRYCIDANDEQEVVRMSLSTIQEHLGQALPEIVVEPGGKTHEGYLGQPMGLVLEEYCRNGINFCLTLAEGPNAGCYHAQVQKLAIFFIESADCVDVTDQRGGYWRVMYLFRKHQQSRDEDHDTNTSSSSSCSSTRYSLAGYMTLYHFEAPFRKPIPGTVVRICQALVLPPYQRMGHGRQMLLTVHQWANDAYVSKGCGVEKFSSDGISDARHHNADALLAPATTRVVEINVEDPCREFTALRCRVDFDRYLCSKQSNDDWFRGGQQFEKSTWQAQLDTGRPDDVSFFQPIPDAVAQQAANHAKITVRQVQIVYEIDRLYLLREFLQANDSLDQDERDAFAKHYRLMVKKRLNKVHREELSACRSKQEMQSLLSQFYDEASDLYERIIARYLLR